jgi:hypothetical protein
MRLIFQAILLLFVLIMGNGGCQQTPKDEIPTTIEKAPQEQPKSGNAAF